MSTSIKSSKIPDGGWGWVVVFASFMISLIADGVSFSFGLFYVDLCNYFGATKSKTAWVASLFSSIPLLTGPFASVLTDLYGCRTVTIISGLLASFGFILGYFATALEHLFVAFSISGLGLSLCYVTSIVIVAYYFEKKLSLATGLAVCGTGIGTFIFAPLTNLLLDTFGWKGTLLMEAGFFLNIILLGALMKDVYPDDNDSDPSESSDVDAQSSHQMAIREKIIQSTPALLKKKLCNRKFSSLVDIPTFIREGNDIYKDQRQSETHIGRPFEIVVNNSLENSDPGPRSKIATKVESEIDPGLELELKLKLDLEPKLQLESGLVEPASVPVLVHVLEPVPDSEAKYDSENRKGAQEKQKKGQNKSKIVTNKTKRDPGCGQFQFSPILFYHNQPYHLQKIRQRGSVTYRNAMFNIRRYRSSSAPDLFSIPSLVSKGESKNGNSCWSNVKTALIDMIDFSVFKSFGYWLFCFSNLLLYACNDVPYLYLPDHATSTGASSKEKSSYLISIIGIVNTLGIVLVGYVGDKPWIRASTLYGGLTAISGVSIALIPFVYSFERLAILAAIYGFSISANYALVSVILVDLISLDNFTHAYGLLLMVQGIASLVGPPFFGWLYDISGNYYTTFLVSGICAFISGAIIIPFAQNETFDDADSSTMASSSHFSSRPSSPNEQESNGKPHVKI